MTDRRRRRSRLAPPDERKKRPKKKEPSQRKPRQAPKIKMVDVHLRLGLEDHLVRIPMAGWHTLLTNWMLGREDVILRGAFRSQEKNIILRGDASGTLTVRSPKEGVNVAMFKVIRAVDMRKELLDKAGL